MFDSFELHSVTHSSGRVHPHPYKIDENMLIFQNEFFSPSYTIPKLKLVTRYNVYNLCESFLTILNFCLIVPVLKNTKF